jgi:hypothetical protein
MTPLQNMTDERVILAAIEVLQRKLLHIRCLAADVPLKEYQRMRQLKDTSGIKAGRHPSHPSSERVPLNLQNL